MSTIFLVRHGQSTWNQAGRIQGKQDPPLSELGRRQARALARALQSEELDAIYTSPQRRAHFTAGAIAAEHGLSITTIGALAEIDHGAWEGLTEPEVEAQFAPSFQTWVTRPSQTQMPGGEHCLTLQARVLDAWHDILAREEDQRILVVSHDIPLKVIVADVLDLPLDHIGRFVMTNAAISIVQGPRDHLRLVQLNDRCHLADTFEG